MPAAEPVAADLRPRLVNAAAVRNFAVLTHDACRLQRALEFEGQLLAAHRTGTAGFWGRGHGGPAFLRANLVHARLVITSPTQSVVLIPYSKAEGGMGIKYANLDANTRKYAQEESGLGGHYRSPRLNEAGLNTWVSLLNEALELHDDAWLANELVRRNFLNHRENYTRQGKVYTRDINIPHAALQLAEGEFNRYYLRGLCRRAQDSGVDHLIIYRGKEVQHLRPESEALIGTSVAVDRLLEALRSKDFVTIEDALKVPGGPNSGLTARLP